MSEETFFDFGGALLKMRQGLNVTRKDWPITIYIGMQHHDREEKNTLPYLYMVKNGERFPATLSNESLLGNDWCVKEFGGNVEAGEVKDPE